MYESKLISNLGIVLYFKWTCFLRG